MSGQLPPPLHGGRAHCTNCVGGWVGPKFIPEALEREKSDPTGNRAQLLGCLACSLKIILTMPSRRSSSDRILREHLTWR